MSWNYGGDNVLRDDAAVLDFGFLPASTAPAGSLHLSTVDLRGYAAGSLHLAREFLGLVTDPEANPTIESEDSASEGERCAARAAEADRLGQRLRACPTSAAQDAELLVSSNAGMGDTEELRVSFRMRRKLALAEAIEQLGALEKSTE